MKNGVLPDWRIRELIRDGVIINADPNLINPSSLDLRVADDKWKLLGSFLPLPGQTVEEALQSPDIVDAHSSKARFYVPHLEQYAVKLIESLDLPKIIKARVFNKSGRGRIGISLRALTDRTPRFNVINNMYKGNLYVEMSSTCFPLVINSCQTAIPQVRFYEGNTQPISGSELELLLRSHPILTDDEERPAYDEHEKDYMVRTGKLTFTADIPQEGLVAYRALRDRRTLDLTLKSFYDPGAFYESVVKTNGIRGILLHPGDFVLIRSKQNVRLPPFVAAEIDEHDPECGDMKTHYAGLINASHGYNKDGSNTHSHIVFEIRARDIPIIIQDGQQLARFSLYQMADEPETRYMERRSTDFGDLKSILPDVFKKDSNGGENK